MHCSSDEILWVKLTPFQETDNTASIEVTQMNAKTKSIEIENVMPMRPIEVKNGSIMPPRSVEMIMTATMTATMAMIMTKPAEQKKTNVKRAMTSTGTTSAKKATVEK